MVNMGVEGEARNQIFASSSCVQQGKGLAVGVWCISPSIVNQIGTRIEAT